MGAKEPSRNRVFVPARQATQSGGIGSLESILGLLKSLKIRAQESGGKGKERRKNGMLRGEYEEELLEDRGKIRKRNEKKKARKRGK
jgi:hypothetical protein